MIAILILILIIIFFPVVKKEKFQIEPVNYNKNMSTNILDRLNINRYIKTDKIKSRQIFRPGTIDLNFKKTLTDLLNPIIKKINKISNTENILSDLDLVIFEKDINNREKYIIDFFTYDNKNYIKTKFNIEIVDKNLNYIKLSNSKYFDDYSLNNPIYNIDTNFVINNNNLKTQNFLNNNLIGVNTSSLEQSNVEKNDNLNGYQSYDVNKQFEIDEVNNLYQQNLKAFPSKKILNQWNSKGVQFSEKYGYGINSSCKERKIIPTFNPTITNLPRDNFGLKDIFSLSTGIASFPTAHSTSGFSN